MFIQSGEQTIFSHYPSGFMWNGSGERHVKDFYRFAIPYAHPPQVHVGIVGLDSGHQRNLRVRVSIETVARDGFELRVDTWGDTQLAHVVVRWIAFGDES